MKIKAYLDLVRWNRPAGWLVLLWPTLSGLWLAAEGFPGWHLLAVFTFGTITMRMAGCCINDVADRQFDRHVKRTKDRPVTTGVVSVAEALILCGVFLLISFGLVLTTNLATITASVLGLVVTVLYPFSKRVLAIPQAVLGVAFSLGIPMAYTAVNGDYWPWHGIFTGPGIQYAWLLLLGNLFWVIAYDTEYAMVDRDDDLKLGIKTSAITFGKYDVHIIMFCYVLFLFIWSRVGAKFAVTGWLYWLGLLVAFVQIIWHYQLISGREREGCFKAFTHNHWVGFSIFAGIVLSGWVSAF